MPLFSTMFVSNMGLFGIYCGRYESTNVTAMFFIRMNMHIYDMTLHGPSAGIPFVTVATLSWYFWLMDLAVVLLEGIHRGSEGTANVANNSLVRCMYLSMTT